MLEIHSEKLVEGKPVVTIRAEGTKVEVHIGEVVSPLTYEAPFNLKGDVTWTAKGKTHSYQIKEWSVMRIEGLASYLADKTLESGTIPIPSAVNFHATRKQNPIVRGIVEKAAAEFENAEGDRIKQAVQQAKNALFALEPSYPGIADSAVIEAAQLRICYLLGNIDYVMDDD